MSVWYLDNDAEITDAVARLRSAEDEKVVLVIPPGSRIATGRINFKLLAREAASRDLKLAVASPDEQVRSLAAAAGVLARATADEAEAALERGETAIESEGPPPPLDARAADGDEGAAGLASGVASGGADATAEPRRLRKRRLALTTGAVLGLTLIGGAAALQVIPTAEIVIVPDRRPLEPILVTVTASSLRDAVDATAGEIPALAVEIPVSAEASFAASGSQTIETRARGEVVFSSPEQSFDQLIPAGTRVSTADGVAFETSRDVVLRPPSGGPGPAQVTALVEAVRAGEEGNVAAGSISVVPSLESQVSVSNPGATTGGDLQESPVITQDDYESAAIDVANRLAGELAGRLRDPDNVPKGLTLFPETARLGKVVLQPSAEELVGGSSEEFVLSGTAMASVLAVDETLVEQVAVERLAGQAPPGMALLDSSVVTEAGMGSVRGDLINYAASARGDAYTVVLPEEVLAEVRGLPVSEARSILERFGTATVSVWPDFLGTLPDDAARITLRIKEPAASE